MKRKANDDGKPKPGIHASEPSGAQTRVRDHDLKTVVRTLA